jgi:hypothetical protein
MIKLAIISILIFLLPSGLVGAYYLGRYLSFKLKVLNDRRRKELNEEFDKLLKL